AFALPTENGKKKWHPSGATGILTKLVWVARRVHPVRRNEMRPYHVTIWIGCVVCLLAPPASARGQQQDEQLDGKKADVMFVLDITGSMQFAITGVEQGLEKIL